MLTELRIRNFALIEELSLECHSGFHILTGETGAGKSILIDAIALLIGGRSSLDLIRSDADEAVLEAVFSIPPAHQLRTQLRENGVLADGETAVVLLSPAPKLSYLTEHLRDGVSMVPTGGRDGIILIGWSTAFFVTLAARMRRR